MCQKSNNRPKIIYTTPELLYPAAGGPYLRVENSIKAINKISELHIICRMKRTDVGGLVAENFYKKNCFNFIFSPSAKKKINYLYYKFKNFFSQSANIDANYIIDYSVKLNINIIWFGFGNISYDLMKEIKTKSPHLRLICDTDSVWSRFIHRGLPFAKSVTKKEKIIKETRSKEFEEKEWVDFCDVTTAVSNIDADYYKSLTNNPNKIMLFSNVIDLKNYEDNFDPPKNFKSPNIFFAGYFGAGSPTDIAARWVIKEVLPLVEITIPNIHFYIVGRGSKETLKDISKKNITVTGQLTSVLPYLRNANVALVPLKFESGTRFKILEAGACNIPIVSTTLGAEGIPVTNSENILIADEPKQFANAIIRLINDEKFSSKISNNCKNLIYENFSIQKNIKEAKEIINRLLKN